MKKQKPLEANFPQPISATGRGKLWQTIVWVAALAVFASAAQVGPKDKSKDSRGKHDALTDYIHRMMGTSQAPAPSSLGSLWVDNGRMANLVSDYASSQVDQRKVGKLSLAIQVAFQELGVFPASTTQIPLDLNDPMPFSTVQAINNVKRNADLLRIASHPDDSLSGSDEESDISTLQTELREALHNEITLHEVALHRESEGLVISLRDFGFFDSGSATIKPESLSALDRIASILSIRTYKLRIEGHTDNIPIHTAEMASNWELSTARSSAIVRVLIMDHRFPPDRLSAAGYAQYHPIASNLTAEGRAQNRRVDIVVLTVRGETTKSFDNTALEKPSPARSQ